MFDTHAHLNFKRYKNNVDDVIKRAFDSGVTNIIIPGTDIASSEKAIDIAQKYDRLYAAVGIHPHHVYEIQENNLDIRKILDKIEKLLENQYAVAVGEVGLDRHLYKKTKYTKYSVDTSFIQVQKELLKKQIVLAKQYKKAVILHNREAAYDLIEVLYAVWDPIMRKKTVFHCCEPDASLLTFAMQNDVFIGVDGDVTYDINKQSFISQVPLEQLVLETDSPFILPEPLKTRKEYPNEPKNLSYIVDIVAKIKHTTKQDIRDTTTENAKRLFDI